jgi:hypothetical protein
MAETDDVSEVLTDSIIRTIALVMEAVNLYGGTTSISGD